MNLEPYITGTYDIAAFRGATAAGVTTLDQSLADDASSGELITAQQKIAQRFLLRLCTAKGSMLYAPAEGAKFITQLQRGLLRTTTAVYAAFAVAESQIKAQFVRDALPTDRPDERFLRAQLIAVRLHPGNVALTIRIFSHATDGVIVLPVPIVV